MKLIDCFMYLDEDILLDLRLNLLNEKVNQFIICESVFNHKGLKKKLNFDVNNFKKFKSKINYIVLDKESPNLIKINNDDTESSKNSKILHNSINRDIFQRNFLSNEISRHHDEDMIFISDLDEIPNLNSSFSNNKINLFCQNMFYYKFNLLYPDFTWYGTRCCKKKLL